MPDASRPFLIGLIVGVSVPCLLAGLVDRLRTTPSDTYPRHYGTIYDDGSLEPELYR